jgi:hypothetical protein
LIITGRINRSTNVENNKWIKHQLAGKSCEQTTSYVYWKQHANLTHLPLPLPLPPFQPQHVETELENKEEGKLKNQTRKFIIL